MAKTAIAIGAIAAAVGTGYSAAEQDKAASKSRGMQKTANQLAQNAALKQENASQDAMRKASRKTPDITALLADAQAMKGPSTMLTGPTGLSGMPTSNLLGV